MKNTEGVSLPLELERRLNQSIDHLRDMREVLEDLGRSADALHRLFGVEQVRGPTRAAPPARPAERAAKARTQREQPATTPPPTKGAQPPPGNAPPAPEDQEEIPEWRKVFPELSSEVPGRRK